MTTSNDEFSQTVCTLLSKSGLFEQIEATQPDEIDMAFTAKVYDTGRDDFLFSMYGNSQKTILIEDVPFAQYWQLENPNQYVFHPMVWGRYIFENAYNSEFRSNFKRLLELTRFVLPNGGFAFYYPNHYPLNRMRGPDVIYSAISQSELLAAFLQLASVTGAEVHENYANLVLDGLLYKYEHGGVNLDNIALLELPMFRSNPEIILNGWLHALLHLNDWAITRQDTNISNLLENNLKFFVENHNAWYDARRNISRYSDSSPMRMVIVNTVESQTVRVLYDGKAEDLKSYVFEPVVDLENEYSAYDTRVLSERGNLVTLGLNCSQMFETIIASKNPFLIRFRAHSFDESRATPQPTGFINLLKSTLMTSFILAWKVFKTR